MCLSDRKHVRLAFAVGAQAVLPAGSVQQCAVHSAARPQASRAVSGNHAWFWAVTRCFPCARYRLSSVCVGVPRGAGVPRFVWACACAPAGREGTHGLWRHTRCAYSCRLLPLQLRTPGRIKRAEGSKDGLHLAPAHTRRAPPVDWPVALTRVGSHLQGKASEGNKVYTHKVPSRNTSYLRLSPQPRLGGTVVYMFP